VTTHAADPIVEVIDSDEEDVGFFSGVGEKTDGEECEEFFH
jgi:hypothetical protein